MGLQRRLARVVVSSSWSRARTQSRIVLYRRCQCTATDRADDGVAIEDTMSSLTCRMFAAMEGNETEGVFSAGASTSYDAFCRLDAAWEDMKTRRVYGLPPKTVRTTVEGLPACPGIDVIVGGGTLGIFVAMALQKRGLRTAVIDRGMVCGRDQDWNVSREELGALVRCGVLTQDEVNDSVTVEFNPIKAGFD